MSATGSRFAPRKLSCAWLDRGQCSRRARPSSRRCLADIGGAAARFSPDLCFSRVPFIMRSPPSEPVVVLTDRLLKGVAEPLLKAHTAAGAADDPGLDMREQSRRNPGR